MNAHRAMTRAQAAALQSRAGRADVGRMRRSVGVALGIVVAGAIALLVALVWLPAVHARQDRAWREAGDRAIAAAHLPAQFHAFHTLNNGSLTCVPHCFVAFGEPRDNASAARDALQAVATGPMRTTCGADGGFAVAPDKCRLVVPVDGSRLDAFLYARFQPPKGKHGPVSAEDFQGTILQLAVAPRT
jgi:hypothetical protein